MNFKIIQIISLLFLIIGLVSSCSKEVEVDIPGYEEQLVVDGFIETGMPPVVILSKSKDIYSPTNMDAFVAGFVTDASIYVSDGTNEYQLSLICSDNLPPGTETIVAGLLGITPEQLSENNICAYTSLDPSTWGQVGKTYNLRIEYNGKTYTGTTQILQPHPLNSVWWQEESNSPDYGFSYANLSDPPGVYDAYKWDVKRINQLYGDSYFKSTFNNVFEDDFFDGKTFTFYYENPWTVGVDSLQSEQRGKYKIGDTVVIKFSKIDNATYDFLYSKFGQAMSNGNPFASAMNIKTNLVGGCLGVWAGYSPVYDTLICQ